MSHDLHLSENMLISSFLGLWDSFSHFSHRGEAAELFHTKEYSQQPIYFGEDVFLIAYHFSDCNMDQSESMATMAHLNFTVSLAAFSKGLHSRCLVMGCPPHREGGTSFLFTSWCLLQIVSNIHETVLMSAAFYTRRLVCDICQFSQLCKPHTWSWFKLAEPSVLSRVGIMSNIRP